MGIAEIGHVEDGYWMAYRMMQITAAVGMGGVFRFHWAWKSLSSGLGRGMEGVGAVHFCNANQVQ